MERIGMFASILVLVITGLFFLVGFGTAEWRKIRVTNNFTDESLITGGLLVTFKLTEGLWRSCSKAPCFQLLSETEDWFNAVRAMECLALLAMLAAGVLGIIFRIFGSKSSGMLLGGLYFLSLIITFVFMLIGVLIYAARGFQDGTYTIPSMDNLTMPAEIHVGYSYILVILSLFGLVFAFNAALADVITSNRDSTNVVT